LEHPYSDRDLSWLSFNERVLLEAAKENVPLLERINFLSIYSSNLDEFYRVRIPALMALQKIKKEKNNPEAAKILQQATEKVKYQLELFGKTLTQQIIPQLKENNIHLIYNEAIPSSIQPAVQEFFFSQVLAFLQPAELTKSGADFFPENNKLYIAALLQQDKKEKTILVNIPSGNLQRFFCTNVNDDQYIVLIDDIIKENLSFIFPSAQIKGAYSFKITRDAELDLEDEYEGDIAEKIEKQIAKRDLGFATRFLYSPDMPHHLLEKLIATFNLSNATIVEGGLYHNLKDLSSFPVKEAKLCYEKWPAAKKKIIHPESLFNSIAANDIILHTPYHDYGLVLRFFNEAAIDKDVEEIYVTLYRIAGDSRIASALISAAKNGKSVTVFVELKARFDEANNIRWAKRMKEAGVKIIYSIPGLKVHAKVALVKKKKGIRTKYYGLLATGNFNESTARFYTDHILMTAHKEMLRELELLFIYLAKRKKPDSNTDIEFKHLLVAQFNLQSSFLKLIQREIDNAKKGLKAEITIKLNNLEEKVMISKLYEASSAGVKINLLVRGICRLVPGIKEISDNISIRRIVDRYLEHGRIFWFHNNGNEEFYAGSADWMNRNIYRRIEVCFPVHDEIIKKEIKEMLLVQLKDNLQAVETDDKLNNVSINNNGEKIRSQEFIYKMIKQHE
jgi:polyphosphate kinase